MELLSSVLKFQIKNKSKQKQDQNIDIKEFSRLTEAGDVKISVNHTN